MFAAFANMQFTKRSALAGAVCTEARFNVVERSMLVTLERSLRAIEHTARIQIERYWQMFAFIDVGEKFLVPLNEKRVAHSSIHLDLEKAHL